MCIRDRVKTCKKNGLNAILKDWKDINPKDFESFDAVISIGAFEHFSSIEEVVEGKQDQIYDDFFKLCSELIPKKGRLFLQTSIWGSNVPWGNKSPTREDIKKYIRYDAPRLSDERTIALITGFFPGSMLPVNLEQIVEAAKPYFKLVSSKNGREDYVQTTREWLKKWYEPSLAKTITLAKMFPRYILGGKKNKAWFDFIRESAMLHAFAGKIFDHERIFFEKV
ncbi:MAG TPA: hypothetical protein ENI23_04370 [bacterium]|nr:hypothetical protein [bacterium]